MMDGDVVNWCVGSWVVPSGLSALCLGLYVSCMTRQDALSWHAGSSM